MAVQIRLVRIFRVFKFGRYSMGLQMFVGCLKASTQAREPLGCSSPCSPCSSCNPCNPGSCGSLGGPRQ